MRADLTEAATLVDVTADVDVVIHAASYVGSDEATATAVNDVGAANLVRECQRTGTRIVLVSTTAVYGPGPHTLAREGELPVHPVSAASVSRSAGEAHVLSAGGKAVRAALTYGGGDRWFIPTALAGVRATRGWVGGGGARLSTIHVSRLAQQVVGLATGFDSISPTVFHAADADPATFREILTSVADKLGVQLANQDIPVDHPLLAQVPAQVLQRAYVDHTYSGELLSSLTGVPSGAGFEPTTADLDWYAAATQN